MKTCTDPEIGQLILAYELGQLSEEETEKFEQHLFACEYCAEDVFEGLTFAEAFKTAIREQLYPEKEIEFSQLQNFSATQWRHLQNVLKQTLKTFALLPKETFVYADAEHAETQITVNAVVKNAAGHEIGHTDIRILETPQIAHEVFSAEFEIMEADYIECQIAVGLKLEQAEMLLTTEYDRIPSDRVVLIREEIGIEEALLIPPAMLQITIVV